MWGESRSLILFDMLGGRISGEHVYAKRRVALLEGFIEIVNLATLGGTCEHDQFEI